MIQSDVVKALKAVEQKEKVRKYNREYHHKRYHEDPEFRQKIIQNTIKSRKKNAQTAYEKGKKYREDNKERIREYLKEWREKNKQKVAEYHRLYYWLKKREEKRQKERKKEKDLNSSRHWEL